MGGAGAGGEGVVSAMVAYVSLKGGCSGDGCDSGRLRTVLTMDPVVIVIATCLAFPTFELFGAWKATYLRFVA